MKPKKNEKIAARWRGKDKNLLSRTKIPARRAPRQNARAHMAGIRARGFIGLWELLTAVGAMDPFFMSSPSRIAVTFVQLMADDFMYHIGVTLLECIIGFAISMLAGCAIAVALWLSPFAKRVAEPYLVVLNALPKVALGPLLIIWVGSGAKAIVLMAVLICIIVTVISVLEGYAPPLRINCCCSVPWARAACSSCATPFCPPPSPPFSPYLKSTSV